MLDPCPQKAHIPQKSPMAHRKKVSASNLEVVKKQFRV